MRHVASFLRLDSRRSVVDACCQMSPQLVWPSVTLRQKPEDDVRLLAAEAACWASPFLLGRCGFPDLPATVHMPKPFATRARCRKSSPSIRCWRVQRALRSSCAAGEKRPPAALC